MHYGLTGLTYSPDRFLELTQSEFEEITTAKAKVVTFVAIEEKFDLVIENYADYERDLLEVSLQRLLSPGNLGDYDRTRGHSHAVARRLVNLLSAARLYLGQVAHDLITVYGPDSPAVARMKEARKKEYDDRSPIALWRSCGTTSSTEACPSGEFRTRPRGTSPPGDYGFPWRRSWTSPP